MTDNETEAKRLMKKPAKSRWLRRISVALMLLIVGLVLITAHYRGEIKTARQQTSQILADAMQHYGTEIQPLDLSSERIAVLLAIEDPAFMSHRGVDFETPGAGMTTISQGLVKLLYFPDGFRPGLAKMRQTLIARYAFDPLVSKSEQLLLMLNMSYLGHHEGKAVHGFANAAQVYFDKPFADLTDEEFVSLVAMLIGPNALKPGTSAHNERVQRINAYLSGEYKPVDLLDVEYDGKEQGSRMKRMMVSVLKLATSHSLLISQ